MDVGGWVRSECTRRQSGTVDSYSCAHNPVLERQRLRATLWSVSYSCRTALAPNMKSGSQTDWHETVLMLFSSGPTTHWRRGPYQASGFLRWVAISRPIDQEMR